MYVPRHASFAPPLEQQQREHERDTVPYARIRLATFLLIVALWPAWSIAHEHLRLSDRGQDDIGNILAGVSSLAAILGMALYRGSHEIIVRQIGELGRWMREHERCEAAARPDLKLLRGGRG